MSEIFFGPALEPTTLFIGVGTLTVSAIHIFLNSRNGRVVKSTWKALTVRVLTIMIGVKSLSLVQA